ncbi:MAG: glutamate--tRNA ligase [Candidatus Latescibacterota bacterium]|nr:glutamate--tRNA ligase [Candidatus Latescibacterota bacterium]
MTDIRVRIAPSPTGPVHVGTAYQALFDLVLARQHGGKFVLRIEDTDQTRSRREYEEHIFQALKWMGLDWDEGPDVGGEYGPYRQSERLEIYQAHAKQLVEGGHAYPCFCTSERLGALRAEQMQNKERLGYDGHCRGLGAEEVAQRSGEDHVIRLKMPGEGKCVVKDQLRGKIELDFGQLDDQVLMKSDGFPTYHMAVVVDDHLMKISHVIRGEEWITSTPKHLVLYEAFGWEVPEYMHLPLLLNPDGSKMSKRRNPTSVEYYRRAGYLPQALLNYLALMAYPPIGEEKFSFDQLIEDFDAEKINLGGSIFDIEKLNWLNGRYVREDKTPEQLLDDLKGWLLNDDYVGQMLPLLQQRMETLGDFMPQVAFFFARKVEPSAEDLVPKKREVEEVVPMLQTAVWALDGVLAWDKEGVEAALRGVAEYWDWPVRDVTVPLIAALTGEKVGSPLFESAALLGQDMTRMRILDAMKVLGGLSKKKAARLEKEWKRK